MLEPWVDYAVREIDANYSRLKEWERGFLKSVKQRIGAGIHLTDPQLKEISKIHGRITDVKPINRRRR